MTTEDKQRISDIIEEHFDDFEPLVLTIENNIDVSIEECINWPFLLIDLATTKAGDIIDYIRQIQSGEYEIVFFKNVDRIRSQKDRADWEKLIVCGLKSEDMAFEFYDKNSPGGCGAYNVSLSKVWVLCTCSEYPEFIKLAKDR